MAAGLSKLARPLSAWIQRSSDDSSPGIPLHPYRHAPKQPPWRLYRSACAVRLTRGEWRGRGSGHDIKIRSAFPLAAIALSPICSCTALGSSPDLILKTAVADSPIPNNATIGFAALFSHSVTFVECSCSAPLA